MTTLSTLSTVASAKAASPASAQREQLAKAAKAFEAIFVRKLMGSMRDASLGDDVTGSDAVDQFQEMSDANTANSLANNGGLGIADLLLKQLGPLNEASDASRPDSKIGSIAK